MKANVRMELFNTVSDVTNDTTPLQQPGSNVSIAGSDIWVAPDFNPSAKNITLAIVLTLIDVVTIFGNLLVLVAFVVERKLFQPFNMFIFNLAVTDFLVAITAMTFYTIDTLLGYWPFGYVMCSFWIYLDFAMTFASVFTLVAISVDRFWCVTWAVHYRANNNKTKTGIILAIIWFCVIAIWTPPFIGDRLKHSMQHLCIWEPSDNTEFVIFVAVIGHYIPCFIMLFCYIKVFVLMRRQVALVGNMGASSMGRNSDTNNSIRTNTTGDDNSRGKQLSPNDRTGACFSTTTSGSMFTKQGFNGNVCQQNDNNASRSTQCQRQVYLDSAGSSSDCEVKGRRSEHMVNKSLGQGTISENSHDLSSGSLLDKLKGTIRPEAKTTRTMQMARVGDYSTNMLPFRAPQRMSQAPYSARERKIFITLTYVLSSYLICWFPFYIAFDTYAWKPNVVPAELYTFFFWMTYVNSTLNPFIYAYTSKEFRSAFIKVLSPIWCKCFK